MPRTPIPDTIRHDEVRALGFELEVFTNEVRVTFDGTFCAASGANNENDMSQIFFERGLEIAFDRHSRGWILT